ncbi:hypothetical protein [Marivirga harenae]|nr:hypothetical protein [Marivirga harenae]WKV13924.1 hypothetical protein Q3Y49_08795 [Marivirga harenae]|tara:strand:- start:238128 stop:238298 length:171 start_codon:yes stop_codon:yes gene_type:complete
MLRTNTVILKNRIETEIQVHKIPDCAGMAHKKQFEAGLEVNTFKRTLKKMATLIKK